MYMKQSIYFFHYLLLTCLTLTGCQQEVLTELSDSGLLLSLSDSQVEVTRSTPAELGKPLATQFNVKIEKNGGQVIYDDKFTEEPIPASAGRYTLTATCGENPVLAWDAPYYKGTATAEVGKGLAKVTIPCTVANALLSISFVNQGVFDQMYSTYGVKVENGSLSLFITAELSTQSTYFQAGSTPKVTFEGTLKDGGQAVSLDLTENLKAHLPLQAGDHARIALRASNTTLKVEKVEVVKETIQETIPADWLPKPKVNGFADGATTLHYVETNDAVPAAIEFTAPTPIQDAEFTLNLEDEHLKQLNGTYTLSTLTEDQRTLLINSGITLPALQTQKGALDLTQLTTNLQTNAGVTTRNKVSLRIKSNDRWSAEQDAATEYVIETVKPEFTVSVQPGNIWTKEFTVDALTQDNVVEGKGNYTKLSQQMNYQFSKDLQTWETLANDLRKSGLQPNTTYYIRGLYRGAVEGSVTEMKTYDAFQIPNSNIEEGYTIEYPKKKNPLYIFNGNWIDTRNEQTCHNNGVNAFYVSKSSTLPVDDNGSNVAHLMTIGWGAGNTCDFGYKAGSVINNISSGILCVGDYKVSNDHVVPREASIRPTALQYIYKASPYNNDEYLIEICMINLSNETETIIGYAKHQSATIVNSYQQSDPLTILYDDTKKNLPITHIKVIFKAGINENRDYLKNKFDKEGQGSLYSNYYLKGSEFWLDSFSLIYDK